MALSVRRVVTANDDKGKAVVWIDEQASNVRSNRPGVESVVVWTTDSVPADITGNEDLGARPVERPPVHHGTIFRIIEFQPGNSTDMHVTPTIDYALVMSGEIDMELDDGVVVHLNEGDVLIQRATVHNWLNEGPGVCKMAFVLMDAQP
jgi:mannose-6-phosphate isomerase-like protein (cupin superfamily)